MATCTAEEIIQKKNGCVVMPKISPVTKSKELSFPAVKRASASKDLEGAASSSTTPATNDFGTEFLKGTISSASLAGYGSTIMSWPTSRVASLVLVGVSLFSAFNTARNNINSPNATNASDNISSNKSTGWLSFIQEKFNSPGIYRYVQAPTYLLTALSALAKRDYPTLASFLMFSVGALAGAGVSNQNYGDKKREKTSFENITSAIWDKIPAKIQAVLSNPGVSFTAGNITLALTPIVKKLLAGGSVLKLFSNPILGILYVAGLASASGGLVQGLAPLWGGEAPKLTGKSAFWGGVGDIAMGAALCGLGNPFLGAATILWGLSNIKTAFEIEPDILKKLW